MTHCRERAAFSKNLLHWILIGVIGRLRLDKRNEEVKSIRQIIMMEVVCYILSFGFTIVYFRKSYSMVSDIVIFLV